MQKKFLLRKFKFSKNKLKEIVDIECILQDPSPLQQSESYSLAGRELAMSDSVKMSEFRCVQSCPDKAISFRCSILVEAMCEVYVGGGGNE